MSNNSTKAKKLSSYSVYKWQEEHLKDRPSIILTNAKFSIHEITSSDGSRVYIVPEDFYVEAKSMFRRMAREEESLKENNKTKTIKEQK